MRIIPVIVLFILLVPFHLAINNQNQTTGTGSDIILFGNQTIGGYGYNNTFYVKGNLSLFGNSSITFINTRIVFESLSGMQSFNVEGNLVLIGSTIVTMGSNLSFIAKGKFQNHVDILKSTLIFSGSFYVSHANLSIRNSTFRKEYNCIPMKTEFLSDSGSILFSSFNITDKSNGNFSSSLSINQNGQPISSPGSYLFSNSIFNGFIPLSDRLNIVLNYTLGNLTGVVNFNIGNSTIGYYNESIDLNKGSRIANISYSLNNFRNISAMSDYGKIPVYIGMPFGENLTIWRSSITFLTNDSLYLNGIAHNFIIFNNSSINMVHDIIISNNAHPYTLDHILNPLKTGVLISFSSNITFISCHFYSNVSGFSPIVCGFNSSYYLLLEAVQTIKSGNIMVNVSNAEPVNVYSSGGTNCSFVSSMEGNIDNIIHSSGKSYHNASGILVYYKNNGSNQGISLFDFKLLYDSWDFYFSVQPSSIFAGKTVKNNYSVRTSYLSAAITTRVTNTSVSISSHLVDNFLNSSNISLNIGISSVFLRNSHSFTLSGVSPNSSRWLNYTFNFTSNENSSFAEISWSMGYNNTLAREYYNGNMSITVPGRFNTYMLNETGMNLSKGWIAFLNGKEYRSFSEKIVVYIDAQKANIFIPGQRMFQPSESNFSLLPGGEKNITFNKNAGILHIIIEGSTPNDLIMVKSVNHAYYVDGNSLNLTISMGNY
ncbi:MAG: hypothetical protein ACYDDC_04850, partial [Thermoplasmataceae archaeon]